MAADSAVETYAAMQIHLDSWRWEGVPFFIRAGKSLPLDVLFPYPNDAPPPGKG